MLGFGVNPVPPPDAVAWLGSHFVSLLGALGGLAGIAAVIISVARGLRWRSEALSIEWKTLIETERRLRNDMESRIDRLNDALDRQRGMIDRFPCVIAAGRRAGDLPPERRGDKVVPVHSDCPYTGPEQQMREG